MYIDRGRRRLIDEILKFCNLKKQWGAFISGHEKYQTSIIFGYEVSLHGAVLNWIGWTYYSGDSVELAQIEMLFFCYKFQPAQMIG